MPSRSGPRTGFATTTTSSWIRSARFGRTCRGSSISSWRSSPTASSPGYPRVYLLARELIAHTAGRFDLDTLVDFVDAPTSEPRPLSIGETWAIPIMLRVALVEELSPPGRRRHRRPAQPRAGPAMGKEVSRLEPDDGPRHRKVSRRDRSDMAGCRLRSSSELLQWLRDQPATAAPAWLALHRALEQQGDTPEELLGASISARRRISSRSATSSGACGCCPRSTGRSSSIASTSSNRPPRRSGAALRGDGFPDARPLPAFGRGAREALGAVRGRGRAAGTGRFRVRRNSTIPQRSAAPVGYYLISQGTIRAGGGASVSAERRERVSRYIFKHPAIGYLGLITLTTAAGVASLVAYASRNGGRPAHVWSSGWWACCRSASWRSA